MNDNNVYITINTFINDKMYRVDTSVSKSMLEQVEYPEQIIAQVAVTNWRKLLDDVGTIT